MSVTSRARRQAAVETKSRGGGEGGEFMAYKNKQPRIHKDFGLAKYQLDGSSHRCSGSI